METARGVLADQKTLLPQMEKRRIAGLERSPGTRRIPVLPISPPSVQPAGRQDCERLTRAVLRFPGRRYRARQSSLPDPVGPNCWAGSDASLSFAFPNEFASGLGLIRRFRAGQ